MTPNRRPAPRPQQASLIKQIAQPRFVLPCMIFVSVLMIGLRVDDLWGTLSDSKQFHAITASQASSAAASTPAKEPEAKEPTKEKSTAKHEPAQAPADFHETRNAENEEAENEIDPSILKQLKERRTQLELRSQELDARETLIKVAEQRVDQKMKEMETLRTQLQSLINSANTAQSAQLENQVKVYESMKAKEAAKIFETLDLPTLLGIIERMKPARVAVIMAEMAPEKAKDITVALTKKDQLPQVK